MLIASACRYACTITNYASPIEKQLDFRFNLSTSSRNEGKCSIIVLIMMIHVTEVQHVFESRGGTRPALEHLLGRGGGMCIIFVFCLTNLAHREWK